MTAASLGVSRWVFEDYWRGVPQITKWIEGGGVQTFTVPNGVTSVFVEMRGGTGGGDPTVGKQTSGGFVSGWLNVEEGEVLNIRVGGAGQAPSGHTGGAGGYNGGGKGGDSTSAATYPIGGYGAGGGSDVRQGGDSLDNRVAVAAGAGGASGFGHIGGAGGPNVGQNGPQYVANLDLAGHGGTQNSGGASGPGGADGIKGSGGIGSNNAANVHSGAGGGGGGYYGGGGGGIGSHNAVEQANGITWAYGGGGGSNYVDGLDASQGKIHNSRGDHFSNLSTKPQAFVSITYTQTRVVYQLDINPNDGGTPNVTKNVTMSQNTGPNRVNIIQEGQSQAPVLGFSGVILTQEHLEAMEMWYDRRVFIKVSDDLGREFYGVFNKFAPHRQRRASNFWYHTFDAEFTLSAYRNASGNWLYGRVF